MFVAQSTAIAVSVWTQLGVGGIFVILVLKEVFTFIEKQKLRRNSSSPIILPADVLRQLNKLQDTCVDTSSLMGHVYEWLKPNADGEQIWKNKQMIELLAEFKVEVARGNKAIENNNRLLERIIPVLTGLE